MSRNFTGNIEVEVDIRYEDQRTDGTTIKDYHDWQLTDQEAAAKLTNGTGETSANRLWHQALDLSSTNSFTQTLDLAGGIDDAFGNTLNLSEVKGFLVHNTSQTTGQAVSIGGASSAFASWLGAANDLVLCGPQGTVAVFGPQDGYTVTAGSGDELEISSAGDDITVEVTLFGDE